MDVAVIGLSCKFPGANNYSEFWNNLIAKRSSITEIPLSRWDWKAYWGDPAGQAQKSHSKWGGFVDDVNAFDANFFGILPKVVETMDPQQRLVMELVWGCLEDAGIAPSTLRGRKVGVMLGVFNHDYKETQDVTNISIEAHYSTGTAASIIANRVSHYFDFKGPSFPIDTACSSSLNAIHSAIQALQYGDCEMVLAGGVNLLLTPTRHIAFSKMGMLSPTGQCMTFDADANGYVRGEGAGLVLLKPLAKAIADGDAIYGVIKGTAVNHCGETYTLTYPSSIAQADVIQEAHERADIPINTVNYIETHGTGTPKGDPIEFEGLLRAFAAMAARQSVNLTPGYCALGSVKTNIGHLEAAAGIAGVIKVLLAFRHQQLPALQNFSRLNPKIAMDETPFSILGESKKWQPEMLSSGGQKLAAPLRAGISSFGFGGTNAHIVLEEFSHGKLQKAIKKPAYLMVLSAKSAPALKRLKANLLDWLDKHPDTHLLDLSAGLLLGRDHHSIRFGCVVKDIKSAIQVLRDDLDNTDNYSVVNKDEPDLIAEATQSANELIAESLVSERKNLYLDNLKKLVALYIKGADPLWSELFAGVTPRRLHLPTYPFDKNTFWIAKSNKSPQEKSHPLLHASLSNGNKTSFYSLFGGDEFFLKDHQVKNQPVLPAVAYLEMMHQAMVRVASDQLTNAKFITEIRDVIWLSPFALSGGSRELRVNLNADGMGKNNALLKFEFISGLEDLSPIKNCQAKGSIVERGEPTQVSDLNYPGADWREYPASDCYERFSSLGFNYGKAHRAIEHLAQKAQQVLVRLVLPSDLKESAGDYILHPSIADGALQAAVALLSGLEDGAENSSQRLAPFLPFSLESLKVYGATQLSQWAWVRPALGGNSSQMKKMDIDIFSEIPGANGSEHLIAQFKGLGFRQFEKDVSNVNEKKSYLDKDNTMNTFASYYTPHWFKQPLNARPVPLDSLLVIGEAIDVALCISRLKKSTYFSQVLIVSAIFANAYKKNSASEYTLRPGIDIDFIALVNDIATPAPKHVLFLSKANLEKPNVDIGFDLSRSAESSFCLVKAYLKSAKTAKIINLVQGNGAGHIPIYQALSAFYKTVAIERPAYSGRVVICDIEGTSDADFSTVVAAEFSDESSYTDIRYVKEARLVRDFVAVDKFKQFRELTSDHTAFRRGGVYLITGGLGALGLLVAGYLVKQYSARVFLTGRSVLSAEKQLQLNAIDSGMDSVFYLPCDITDEISVKEMVQKINNDGFQLNGVIHSAGVIEDSFLLRKNFDSFSRVISPKVKGTINLDLATKDQPLDLFVLFSSVTGVLGNLGQCDYAFGNCFEDYYSFYRNDLLQAGERSGKSVSINWPYWKEGGMVLTDKEEQILRKNFGIIPLENANGLRALEFAISAPVSQVSVLEGDASKIHQVLGVRTNISEEDFATSCVAEVAVSPAQPFAAAAGDSSLKDNAVKYLISQFAREVALPEERFELYAPFQQYGFDSVVMVNLVKSLEGKFASLPATLFFEYQNINDLADFFISNYPSHFSAEELPVSALAPANNAAATVNQHVQQNISRIQLPTMAIPAVSPAHLSLAENQSAAKDDIVIIGVSGRYPEAENLVEFWHNLKNGVDCIREIPADREWSLENLFQPGAAVLGKSYSKWGGFLKNIDQFDPLFFGISPAEAEVMDPHERLFLETVALAMEDAGYCPDKLAQPDGIHENPVGVYVGTMWGDYQLFGVDGETPKNMIAPRSWYWAVANRISYQFNFSGPSITFDTACSSSLTAIHLACDALKQGDINVAIAGGVNLSLHPQKYNTLSDLHFLSSDGRCRSFGAGGDGYVPAEAVGAIILKRKADAVRDGDHIYAVIKSSSINHGGKTSGFTVPNPNRQGALIKDAIARSGINSRHISYVEAHGTGTSLGDPIEISGLSKAFDQSEAQYCAIGSVKSNIGHAEAAAGVAGITKILLQLKHRMLAPSLHSNILNPYAKIDQSPFYVLQKLEDWQRPTQTDSVSGEVTELPRIAGLSSFGAGGANAHLIIEEYPYEADPRHDSTRTSGPVLVLLSAKREDSLEKMAIQLQDFILREPKTHIADIAYTLQTGRVSMDFSLALIASTLAELQEKLNTYFAIRNDNGAAAGIYYGKRPRNKNAKNNFTDQQINDWLARGDLNSLAGAWLAGQENIAWAQLYSSGTAFRISVPGYVYSRQRYWVTPAKKAEQFVALDSFIDANISTLDEQLFVKTFTQNEFYLRDHKLGKKSVLPGVAYLEMARQAAKLATNGEPVLGLADIKWLKPIVINGPRETIHIGLQPNNGNIEFEIFKIASGGNRIVFCIGAAIVSRYSSALAMQSMTVALPMIDPHTVKARSTQLTQQHINTGFERLGFGFGPSFQIMKSLYTNQVEAMAELSLAAESLASRDVYVLHPALLDGALRTALGIGGLGSVGAGMPLPISLGRILIYKPLPEDCISYAVYSPSQPAQLQQKSYDIYILNTNGEILAALLSFTTQYVSHFAEAKKTDDQLLPAMESRQTLMATSVAQVKQIASLAPVAAQSITQPAEVVVAMDKPLNRVKKYLTDLVAQFTKIPAAQIDTATALENYGIDSVMIMAMNEKLIELFGQSVAKTLFFEYQDIDSLAEYFSENHAEDIRKLAPVEEEVVVALSNRPVQLSSKDRLLDIVRNYLSQLFSRFTKIEQSQIDCDTPTENYGIDSVMILGMIEHLENDFGKNIPKTLFFECQTINELADFLLENHSVEVQALANAAGATVIATTTVSTAMASNETQIAVAGAMARSRFVNSSTEMSYTQNSFAHSEQTVNEPRPDYVDDLLNVEQDIIKDKHIKLSAAERLKRTISALSDSEVENLLRELLESDELEAEF